MNTNRFSIQIRKVLYGIVVSGVILLTVGLNKLSIAQAHPVDASAVTPFLYMPLNVDWWEGMTAMMDHQGLLKKGTNRDGILWTYIDQATAFNPLVGHDLCANYEGNIGEKYCTKDKLNPNYLFAPGYEFRTADGMWAYYDGHEGYDYGKGGVTAGTSVFAAANGVVECAGWGGNVNGCLQYSSCFGYMIVIDHQNGYKTLYGHLQDGSKNPDNLANWPNVTANDRIGLVGNTSNCGTSTGNHLHFSVLHNGKYTDPFGWSRWGWPQADPLGSDANGEASVWLWVGDWPHRPNSNAQEHVGVPPNLRYLGGEGDEYVPAASDNAAFIFDITLPDDTAVSPGQALTKTWRMKNTGSSTWGSGYQLVFRQGDRLGAPESVNVPATQPGQEINLSVPLQVPANAGSGVYSASWQLRNSSGTYFGPLIWFRLKISGDQPPGGNGSSVSLVSINIPSALNPGQQFWPDVTVYVNNGQLLQSRGDMLRHRSGENYSGFPHVAVQGSVSSGQSYTFEFYDDHPFVAPSTRGTYESRWQVWANGGWVGPEIVIRFSVYQGAGSRPPNKPSLTSPYDWSVLVGQMPTLCAQHNGDPDGDPVNQYRFVIFESAQNWDSGWVSNSCVTPQGLGNYGYQWHAQVRDSGGNASEWSDTWHFNLESSTVTITDFHFEPASPSRIGPNPIACRACTSGCGGVGVGLKVLVNTATDGSSNGEWRQVKELGVPCFNAVDAPQWETLEFEEGIHRMRLEATSCDGTIVVREELYTLQRGVPSRPSLLSPSNAFWSDSRTITFRWKAALRANNYTLIVGTTPDPELSPVLIINLSSTEYTTTFNQDYPQLYWRVYANNEFGRTEQGGWWVGIDRTPPTSAINLSLTPSLSYENQFVVSWDGSDAASGPFRYDVQFRLEPDGQWYDWLGSYPYTTAIFTGQPGMKYGFRVRAHDVAGNTEAYPDLPGATVLVDPTERPPQAWWNSAYAYKRNLVIVNPSSGQIIPSGYVVRLHFDDNTTPSAATIYASSIAPNKGDDIRVIYNDQTEMSRHILNFSTTQIDIAFPLQGDIGANGSSSSYSLYYGNASPTPPLANLGNVYQPRPDSNTMSLWYMEEASGSTTSDSSGHGNTLTWVNGPVRDLAFGKLGRGAQLNGNQWGTASSGLNVGNQLTAEVWVKFTSLDSSWRGIVSKFNEQTNNKSWRITLFDDSPKIRADVQIIDNSGTPQGRTLIWDHTLQTNLWYHVAVTFDGATARLWVNGSIVASVNQSGRVNDSPEPIYVGRNNLNDPPLMGYVDSVRISNVARTSFPYAQVLVEPSGAAGEEISHEAIGPTDLVLEDLSAQQNANGNYTIQATMRNQGSFPTYNEFFIHLYANRVPTGPGDLTDSISFWVNAPVLPGDSVILTSDFNSQTASLFANQSAVQISNLSGISELPIDLYAQVDSTGAVKETDNINNIVDGPQICFATGDSFEADNTYDSANLITTAQPQIHNFNVLGDRDWVKFNAQKGSTYRLTTSDLGLSADTYLYLYDKDGMTLISANDDFNGTLASQIEWTAPSDGTYYALIAHWNPTLGGCHTNYTVSISKLGNPAITKTFNSNGLHDGWILESGEFTNKGGSLNASATTFFLGDNAQDKQYRSILSFNTAGLPDNAVVTKVTLKIRKQGLGGTNPFTTHNGLKVDIRKGRFGSSVNLQALDFQAFASKNAVGTFIKTPTNNWYSANLSSIAFPYVNLTGVTQFRLRFAKDDNNDNGADYMKFFSGNAALWARPQLIIEYYVP